MSITVLRTYCSMLALLILANPVNADVYKWVDEQGQTHYSQTAPDDGQVEIIKTTPAVDVDIDKAQQEIDTLIQQQAENDKLREQKEEEQRKLAAEAALKAENCQAAKTNLQLYQNSPGRRMTDAEGNVTRPSEEARQDMIKKLKEAVSEFCL